MKDRARSRLQMPPGASSPEAQGVEPCPHLCPYRCPRGQGLCLWQPFSSCRCHTVWLPSPQFKQQVGRERKGLPFCSKNTTDTQPLCCTPHLKKAWGKSEGVHGAPVMLAWKKERVVIGEQLALDTVRNLGLKKG